MEEDTHLVAVAQRCLPGLVVPSMPFRCRDLRIGESRPKHLVFRRSAHGCPRRFLG